MKRARRRQSGLTMLEVIIASVILTAIVAMSAYLVWSSSRSVSSSEAALQLENMGREVLNVMTAELREAKRSGIAQVKTQTIRVNPPANIHTMAPKDPKLGIDVTPVPEGVDFDAIRFDLIDPGNNFKLDDFKNSTERIYTIQYWWQVEYDEQKKPFDVGNGPNGREPNGVDDNQNGVVDEGVIMKMETWFEADRVTVRERKFSTVLRNVKKLAFRVPAAGAVGGVNYKSDRIEITLSMEIRDPKIGATKVADAPGKEVFLITRTLSKVVDFRN